MRLRAPSRCARGHLFREDGLGLITPNYISYFKRKISGVWFTITTELFFVVPRYDSTPIAIELITHPSLKPRLPC